MSSAAAASARWPGRVGPTMGAVDDGVLQHPGERDLRHGDAAVPGDRAAPRPRSACRRAAAPSGPTVSVSLRAVCSPHGRARRPLASGLHGMLPTPWSASRPNISRSSSRCMRLYWFCIDDELRPPVQLGGVLQLGELPGPHRGGPDVAGLARLDHVVQRFHRLLGRRLRVEAVDLVQVDVVGAEPGQGGVDLLHDRPPGQAGTAGAVAHLEEHLGREHDVLAAGVLPDRPADDLLGRAVAVGVRGVPEGDPELDGLPEDRLGRSSSSAHWLKPRDVSPKLMQPSAMRLTLSPEVPSRVYSMSVPLSRRSSGQCQGNQRRPRPGRAWRSGY